MSSGPNVRGVSTSAISLIYVMDLPVFHVEGTAGAKGATDSLRLPDLGGGVQPRPPRLGYEDCMFR